MNKQSHFIFGYSFDKEGVATKLEDKVAAASELRNDGLSWVHLDVNSKQAKKWLQKEVSYLDHLILDALLAEHIRPRITKFENGFLIILRGIDSAKNQQNQNEHFSIRIWIDGQRVITLQKRDSSVIQELANEIDLGKKVTSSAEFLYNLTYKILDSASSEIYNLNEKLDDLEDEIVATSNVEFGEAVTQIRTISTRYRSFLAPQKKAIESLCEAKYDWIDDWSNRHFHENLEQITRLLEECENALSRSHILHQDLSNAMTHELNKSIYKISLITVVFMPLTFVTGLFGMNVGGIPGSNNHNAFFICASAMILFALTHFWLTKRNDKFK